MVLSRLAELVLGKLATTGTPKMAQAVVTMLSSIKSSPRCSGPLEATYLFGPFLRTFPAHELIIQWTGLGLARLGYQLYNQCENLVFCTPRDGGLDSKTCTFLVFRLLVTADIYLPIGSFQTLSLLPSKIYIFLVTCQTLSALIPWLKHHLASNRRPSYSAMPCLH